MSGTAAGDPRFIIIGAGRSGTTSLYHYLRQHPRIFMTPIKETNFFASPVDAEGRLAPPPSAPGDLFPVRSAGDYAALFADAPPGAVTGEASPLYLYAPGTAERIARAAPEARIIAILRNPVDRAWSNYLGCVRDGVEERTFEEAVREELAAGGERPLQGPANYVRAGHFARNLKPYFDRFARERIALFLYDDFARDPASVTGELFGFLGVDTVFVPDISIRYNATGIPRSRRLHRLIGESGVAKRIKSRAAGLPGRALMRLAVALKGINLAKPALPPVLRRELADFYREDVVALQSMIGRDLRHWFERK